MKDLKDVAQVVKEEVLDTEATEEAKAAPEEAKPATQEDAKPAQPEKSDPLPEEVKDDPQGSGFEMLDASAQKS